MVAVPWIGMSTPGDHARTLEAFAGVVRHSGDFDISRAARRLPGRFAKRPTGRGPSAPTRALDEQLQRRIDERGRRHGLGQV